METILDLIGIVGVIISIIAYFLLQVEKIQLNGFYYSFLNLISSIFLISTLITKWNISIFLIEFFWISISIYGMFKWWKTRRREKR